MELNLKFKTIPTYSVKFCYPWHLTENEGAKYISLNEEIIELIWNSGDYQQRIAEILKREFLVKDWDWEDDGDDYIEVFFKAGADSDQLAHDIEDINRQFSNEWDKLVKEARGKIEEYKKDEEPDNPNYWTTRHTPKDEICSNCKDSVDRCDCQLMGIDEAIELESEEDMNINDSGDDEGWDANIPEVSGIWDTNAPEPKKKEEGWNVWNR